MGSVTKSRTSVPAPGQLVSGPRRLASQPAAKRRLAYWSAPPFHRAPAPGSSVEFHIPPVARTPTERRGPAQHPQNRVVLPRQRCERRPIHRNAIALSAATLAGRITRAKPPAALRPKVRSFAS